MTRLVFTQLDADVWDYLVEHATKGPDGWEVTVANKDLARHLGHKNARQACRHWRRLEEMGLLTVHPRFTDNGRPLPNRAVFTRATSPQVGDLYQTDSKEGHEPVLHRRSVRTLRD